MTKLHTLQIIQFRRKFTTLCVAIFETSRTDFTFEGDFGTWVVITTGFQATWVRSFGTKLWAKLCTHWIALSENIKKTDEFLFFWFFLNFQTEFISFTYVPFGQVYLALVLFIVVSSLFSHVIMRQIANKIICPIDPIMIEKRRKQQDDDDDRSKVVFEVKLSLLFEKKKKMEVRTQKEWDQFSFYFYIARINLHEFA